jgi:hypothetical protein
MDANFEMFRGDTRTLTVTIKDRFTGAVVDLTGASIAWRMAKTADMGNSLTMSKSVGSGITVASPTSGVAVVTINPTDTSTLIPGDYYHDLTVTDASARVVTVLSGRARIKQDLKT